LSAAERTIRFDVPFINAVLLNKVVAIRWSPQVSSRLPLGALHRITRMRRTKGPLHRRESAW
jgi:hypothetical protein